MYLSTYNLFWKRNVSFIALCLIQLCRMSPSLGENCEDIKCSNIIDYVCGATEGGNGSRVFTKFQNICVMRKTQCQMQLVADIWQVPDKLCNIEKKYFINGRRVHDFGIVGSHQVCNHTCPTFCIDTYEPACARIWRRNATGSTTRAMINHCHIDLFSCAIGVNVTIIPLAQCFKNTAALTFMSNVANMKSLRLLDDELYRRTFMQAKRIQSQGQSTDNKSVKQRLKDILRKIMEYDRNSP